MAGLSHKNPPAWLENNPLFRGLFLFRKLVFTKLWFTHFAGFAEDVSVSRFFDKKYKGFYVDIGCYHPIKYSTTYFFYRRGWRGINVDIDDLKISLFRWIRRGDHNVVRAVSHKDGVTQYFRAGLFSQINSINPDYAKKLGKQYPPKQVRCSRLTTILDESPYKDRPIDFLKVDAEGHDLMVLQSLDWHRYRPSIVAVEVHETGFNRASKNPIYLYIKTKGYTLVAWTGETIILASKTKLEELNGKKG